MKNLIVILFTFLIVSCETKKNVQDDISKLQAERNSLKEEVQYLRIQKNELSAQDSHLKEEIAVEQNIESGKTPHYVLTIKLKQTHYSLSLKKQLSDISNATSFDLAVDKEVYDKSVVGEDLFQTFRTGSLIFKGSAGTWELKVIDKKITYK